MERDGKGGGGGEEGKMRSECLGSLYLGGQSLVGGQSREGLFLDSQSLIQENDRIFLEQAGTALRQLIRKDRGSCVGRGVRRK